MLLTVTEYLRSVVPTGGLNDPKILASTLEFPINSKERVVDYRIFKHSDVKF